MDTSFLKNIKTLPFPDSQYYKEVFAKSQIVLHHTASGKGADGDYQSFLSDPSRIAVCIIVDYNGTINQLYSSKFWGHHLGIKDSFLKQKGFSDFKTRNVLLNKRSIPTEIDSWGGLLDTGGKYYSYLGREVPKEEVISYKSAFRTYPISNFFISKGVAGKPCYLYQKYSNEQIESVKKLLVYWNSIYKIPLDYHEDMWDVSMNALKGVPGIWTHVSYRTDKSDCHPQPELVTALKTLSTKAL
jgi:hypothetical protein